MDRRHKVKSKSSLLKHSPDVVQVMEMIKHWKPSVPSVISTKNSPKAKKIPQLFISLHPEEVDVVLSEICERPVQSSVTMAGNRRMHTAEVISETEYKRQLGLVFDEKIYLERLLVSEHKRMKFLLSKSRRYARIAPFTRIWLELLLSGFSDRSEVIKTLSANELSHISGQYGKIVRINYWQRLQDLVENESTQTRVNQHLILREKLGAMTRTLNSIWNMYMRAQYREAAYTAVRVLQKVDTAWSGSKPSSLKWRVEADLCYTIGMCLDGLGRNKAALTFFQMDARIAEHADIILAKKRALDNIGRMYAVLGKYREALVCWSERMKTDVEGEELAWLLYQIALCYTMLDDYKEATRYARNCANVAESAGCLNWALSGHLLQATVFALNACRSHNDNRMLQSSLISLEEAYNFALRTNRSNVINAVLEIIRNVYNMMPTSQVSDDHPLYRCWSSALLDLLKQDRSNRSQFNMRVLREQLLQSGMGKLS